MYIFFFFFSLATLPPLVTLTLDCDGYADGDYWEPQPCEFCSCELGFKACYSPLCAIPCENPIHREGVCCPTCPDVTCKCRFYLPYKYDLIFLDS